MKSAAQRPLKPSCDDLSRRCYRLPRGGLQAMKPWPARSRARVSVTGIGLLAIVFSLLAFNSCSKVVAPHPIVTHVDVTPALDSLMVGGTFHFTAVARNSVGQPVDKPVSWSSNNTSVASVDATGWVAGHAAGAASITAFCDGQTGRATVIVLASSSAPVA